MSLLYFIVGFMFGIALTIRFPHVPAMASELIKRAKSGENIVPEIPKLGKTIEEPKVEEVVVKEEVKEDKEISKPGA